MHFSLVKLMHVWVVNQEEKLEMSRKVIINIYIKAR
jgi:hypothetical protein